MLSYKNNSQTVHTLLSLVLKHELKPVFDIDGVLLDATHRCKFDNGILDLEHYRKYSTPELINKDKNLPLLDLVHKFNQIGVSYDVCTARVMCEPNRQMIASRGINPVNLMCRDGDRDSRRDHVLKRDKLTGIYTDRELKNILLIDDVKGNIRTMAALGCWIAHIDYELVPKDHTLLDIRPLLA